MFTIVSNFPNFKVCLNADGELLMLSDVMVRYEGTLEFHGSLGDVMCVQR